MPSIKLYTIKEYDKRKFVLFVIANITLGWIIPILLWLSYHADKELDLSYYKFSDKHQNKLKEIL